MFLVRPQRLLRNWKIGARLQNVIASDPRGSFFYALTCFSTTPMFLATPRFFSMTPNVFPRPRRFPVRPQRMFFLPPKLLEIHISRGRRISTTLHVASLPLGLGSVGLGLTMIRSGVQFRADRLGDVLAHVGAVWGAALKPSKAVLGPSWDPLGNPPIRDIHLNGARGNRDAITIVTRMNAFQVASRNIKIKDCFAYLNFGRHAIFGSRTSVQRRVGLIKSTRVSQLF